VPVKKKTKKRGIIAKSHAWLGFISSFFILSLAITGLLLNHPDSIKRPSNSKDPFYQNPHYSYITTEGSIYLATESQLYISKDKGGSFSVLKTPFSAKYTIAITESDHYLWLALKNGVVFKADKQSHIWEIVDGLSTLEIFSLSYHDAQLWLTGYEGLYKYSDESWELIQRNTSPMSFHSLMKALHTGYPPFQWLHNINSIAAIILIIILISGISLFFKLYIKTWFKKIN
tara:strand:- start:2076 stop:2765 length:690 start_codon:yes stop_codon:yes gene_type:complete